MAHKLVFLALASLIAGCAQRGAVIEDLSDPLVELQRMSISALPLGKRKQSQNAREFHSEYFLVNEGVYEKAVSASERRQVQISILGDRRPYSLAIRVNIERRAPSGQYTVIREDEGLARVIMRRIQKALAERREDRNIIDDFRVF